MRNRQSFSGVVLWVTLLLTACTEPTPPPTVTATVTALPTPSPVPTPTSTATPFPVLLTPRPVPQPVAPISPANTDQIVQLARRGSGWIRGIAWAPDGRFLAVAGSLGISLFDGEILEELGFIESLTGMASVAYSPDGDMLASGGFDNTVQLWDSSTGDLLRMLEGHVGWVESVAFSPDGRLLASAGSDDDGTLRLWGVRP
ncbi:MAG: WD40 repeat domain-containing protein [Anaerolineales bacterium]